MKLLVLVVSLFSLIIVLNAGPKAQVKGDGKVDEKGYADAKAKLDSMLTESKKELAEKLKLKSVEELSTENVLKKLTTDPTAKSMFENISAQDLIKRTSNGGKGTQDKCATEIEAGKDAKGIKASAEKTAFVKVSDFQVALNDITKRYSKLGLERNDAGEYKLQEEMSQIANLIEVLKKATTDAEIAEIKNKIALLSVNIKDPKNSAARATLIARQMYMDLMRLFSKDKIHLDDQGKQVFATLYNQAKKVFAEKLTQDAINKLIELDYPQAKGLKVGETLTEEQQGFAVDLMFAGIHNNMKEWWVESSKSKSLEGAPLNYALFKLDTLLAGKEADPALQGVNSWIEALKKGEMMSVEKLKELTVCMMGLGKL